MMTLVSTRFTNDTWEENIKYREKINCIGCIYGSPVEMSPKILFDSFVFVIEMNNTINKIQGIGLIKNISYCDKYYKIHNDANYNRYIFKSKYYLNREILIRINSNIIEILENILFKGKTHSKRGSGFTKVPEKILNNEIYRELHIKNTIKKIFLQEFNLDMII